MAARKTVTAPEGTYAGAKCPACPAVLQPAATVDDGRLSEREGLRQHWLIVHPERPFKQRDAR